MVEKLFWKDPYMTECEAKVTMISGKTVQLDRTIFFASAGGQASDTGTINNIPVIEAKKNFYEILYTLEHEPNFKEGDTVKLKLDWDKRYKTMRLHSVAEITYVLFERMFGTTERLGSSITPEKARIDYVYPKSVAPELPKLEAAVNEWVEKDLPITRSYDPSEKDKLWWEVIGFDKHSCGGTHVKTTGEIGKIKLKRSNIGAGKERIEIYLNGEKK